MSDPEDSNGNMDESSALQLSHLLKHNREELLYIAGEVLRTPALAYSRLGLKRGQEKPIGYIGWLGHRNLGDEVMFQLIQSAFSEFPITPFIAPPGERLLALLKLGGSGFFRAIFLGGGTLINSTYLASVQLASSFRVPIYTIGTGVGSPGFGISLHQPLGNWRDVLRDSPSVSVRGPLSKCRLEEAGFSDALVIGDPALGLAPESPPLFRTRNRLLINLTQEPGTEPFEGKYSVFRHVGSIAAEFASRGGEVVGIALGNKDKAVLQRFRREFQVPTMVIESHRSSVRSLLPSLAGSIGLIGVRLHSAILASCLGVPSILFSYRDKCADFMNSMELSEFVVPLSESLQHQDLVIRWNKIVHEPQLGMLIYERALQWKRIQQSHYQTLANHLRQTKMLWGK